MNITLPKQKPQLFSRIQRKAQYMNDGISLLIAETNLAEIFMKMYNNDSVFF